jgi:hypothetical protein
VKFGVPAAGALIGVSMWGTLLATSAAAAPPAASATATAHALDEQANCRAQHRPECPTETETATARPTATPTLTATPTAADTPAPAPTDLPSPGDPPLPLPDAGQAVAAYVRPTPRDPSGTWLELAVPNGRWAVLYDSSVCAAPAPWTNVWLAADDQSGGPITVDRDGNMCAVTRWSWTSDVPCAADDQGACAVEMDGAYLDAIGQAGPAMAATPEPVLVSTPTPRPPVPTVTPYVRPAGVRGVQQPVPAAPAARAADVEATPPPHTPTASATSTLGPTAVPTRTPAATPTTLPSDTPTPLPATAVVAVQAVVAETPVATATAEVGAPTPEVAADDATPALMPSHPADWSLYVMVGAAVLVIAGFYLLVGRTLVRPR